jgi:EAL domain-containing protein (putative c-di-GMP-specific phosphodiesterase class I)/ActR/RegA family two-component response regulator
MQHHATIDKSLNLLLVVQDEAWRTTAVQSAGRSTPIAVATSPEDAVQQLLRAHDAFTHVMVEARFAANRMAEIANLVARHPDTKLVVLGDETAVSAGIAAVRAVSRNDLAHLIGTDPSRRNLDALTPADIIKAFDAGQVECQFQPIVRLTDGKPVGLEALARLQHPLRGTLTPDTFLPQIENSGLSMRLSEVVVQAALGSIDRQFLERNAMYLTINLPLDVLLVPDALSLLETYRHAAGIDIRNILIELTESRPVFDIPVLNTALLRWREAGYHLAIDDLGPEMVNQTDLFDLPFHVVKLDKTIVLRSRTNQLAQRYLQRTIANAQARSLRIIAEGIEDGALWIRMRDLGVDYAQGFLISRAMPAAALEDWLKSWDARLREPA